jgi:hypothetical protein
MKIQIRIGPPHPTVCRKKHHLALDETGKTEAPHIAGVAR